jgi:hypothetical protein
VPARTNINNVAKIIWRIGVSPVFGFLLIPVREHYLCQPRW